MLLLLPLSIAVVVVVACSCSCVSLGYGCFRLLCVLMSAIISFVCCKGEGTRDDEGLAIRCERLRPPSTLPLPTNLFELVRDAGLAMSHETTSSWSYTIFLSLLSEPYRKHSLRPLLSSPLLSPLSSHRCQFPPHSLKDHGVRHHPPH